MEGTTATAYFILTVGYQDFIPSILKKNLSFSFPLKLGKIIHPLGMLERFRKFGNYIYRLKNERLFAL